MTILADGKYFKINFLRPCVSWNTKNLMSWIVAPGKILTFINFFCDIFDSLRSNNMELATMRVVPFFYAGTVLLLSSNNTSHLFSVSFDGKGSRISHVSMLNWGSILKSIIESLLLWIKASLHGSLKLPFNVDGLLNSLTLSLAVCTLLGGR